MQDKARAWTLSLLPTLQQQVRVVAPHGQAIDVFVRVGSAIAGLEEDEHAVARHRLWGDLAAQRLRRTTCLLVFSAAGLAADLASLAHLAGRLGEGAKVAFAHGLKKLSILSREQLLRHCEDPWAELVRSEIELEGILPALERAFIFRRFASVGHATVGMEIHRHGGFDNGGYRWLVTAPVTASGTSTLAQADAQKVEDFVNLAIRVLKDRNSPIWTRGVVSRHQSRGEEALIATEGPTRARKKRYSRTLERGLFVRTNEAPKAIPYQLPLLSRATVMGKNAQFLSGSVVQLIKLTHAEPEPPTPEKYSCIFCVRSSHHGLISNIQLFRGGTGGMEPPLAATVG